MRHYSDLIGRLHGKFDSTNQKHYPDLGSDASSVWNLAGNPVVVSPNVVCLLRQLHPFINKQTSEIIS